VTPVIDSEFQMTQTVQKPALWLSVPVFLVALMALGLQLAVGGPLRSALLHSVR
jgi:hypothetical protein